ncbi:MAG: integration host factor subunit beta [candidate division Zixibacteria bacterium]|nr:integration host factor subunit beta [candidate division Zixibacteria bacterium]
MTTTRKELVNAVSDSLGLKKADTYAVIDTLFDVMRSHLMDGNRIEIRGFGALEIRDTRPKSAARNPRTGDTIAVPARRKARFKPGKILKEALRAQRKDTP